jgi:hypothetical protein
VKVDQQIINNLQEAESIKQQKLYGSFDEMILSRCIGKRTRDGIDDEIVGSVWSWLINKKLSGEKDIGRYEYYWNNWTTSLKEDFYRVFIRAAKENNFAKRLIISMAEVTNWDADATNFKNLISKCGKFDSIKFNEIYEIVNGIIVEKSTDKISFKDIQTPIGVYRNYGYEVWVYVHYSKGVQKVELRVPDGYVNNVRYEISFNKFMALEDYIDCVKKCRHLDDIYNLQKKPEWNNLINIVSYKEHSILPYTEYGALLELYTGYLKYGSVDNYIKYCQEDDERVALNTKIA